MGRMKELDYIWCIQQDDEDQERQLRQQEALERQQEQEAQRLARARVTPPRKKLRRYV